MLDHIHHVNLVVEDLEVMTAFYRDVLEMKVTRKATISGDWIEAVTGIAGVEADVVFLQASSGPGIELLKYRTPTASRPPGLSVPNTPGLRHLAFQVQDLDRAVAALEKAGAHLVGQPQLVAGDQVSYSGGKRLVYFHDPEGNLLELCWFGVA